MADIDGDYSAHSLRRGFVSEANRQSTPLAETMAMTGHRSVKSVIGYSQIAQARGRAAKLAELD